MRPDQLNDDATYSHPRFRGVALRYVGPAKKWEPMQYYAEDPDGNEVLVDDVYGEGEWVDDLESNMARVIMVGDDRIHEVDADELTELADDEYCSGCGQIGCGWC